MQLRGLSSVQWNGCIVDVGMIDKDLMRYSCEVITGESKGRKLAVKIANLTEVPPPSPHVYVLAASKFLIVSCELESFKANKRESNSMENSTIDKILHVAEELSSVVPNCAALWNLYNQICTYFFYQIPYLIITLTPITCSNYTVLLKLDCLPEPAIYLRRAVANSPLLQDMTVSDRLLTAAGLGKVYFKAKQFEEAAIQFKRVVEANILPYRDNWLHLLALCDLGYGKLADAVGMFSTMYRKRVYEFDRDCLALCFEIDYPCLRESIYHILSDLAKQYTEFGLKCATRVETMKMEHPEHRWGSFLSTLILLVSTY